MKAGTYRLPQQLPGNAATEVQWKCSRIEQGQSENLVTPELEIKVEEGQVVVCVAGHKQDQPGPMNVGESSCHCHC
jgi:hypothetical protein